MLSRSEIFQRVSHVLQTEFDFEPGEISLESHLVNDLEMTTLDAMPVLSGLEQAFQVRIRLEELLPEDIMEEDAGYLEGEVITEKALAYVENLLPGIDLQEIRNEPTLEHLQKLLTVKSLVLLMEEKLRQDERDSLA